MPNEDNSAWLIEEGIGETRAIQLDGETITAAIIEWDGRLAPGCVEDAQLTKRIAGTPRGMARFANGEMVLVDRLPKEASEGAKLRLEVTRSGTSEARRSKLAQARPTDKPPRPSPSLVERLEQAGETASVVHSFPRCDWDELTSEAQDAQAHFTHGSLHFSSTPAMLLIDIDGHATPRELALAAVPAIAQSLKRFSCGGSIGIDFPTLQTKADRRAVDEALANALGDWRHERTSMNGFGFVQIVAKMERPSLLNFAAHHPANFAARQLLRRAERLEGAGSLELTAHPAVLAQLSESWLAELRRRTGRNFSTRPAPDLAISAPQAQLVTP